MAAEKNLRHVQALVKKLFEFNGKSGREVLREGLEAGVTAPIAPGP
jgi:hypothetical protein